MRRESAIDVLDSVLEEMDREVKTNISSYRNHIEQKLCQCLERHGYEPQEPFNPRLYSASVVYVRHTLADLVHNTFFGRPDIILVGETHNEESHALDQARMIRRHKPEYVLLEGLDQLNPEDTQEPLSMYELCTLNELSRQIDVPLTDMGIDKSLFKPLEDTINQEVQRITESYIQKGVEKGKQTKKLKKMFYNAKVRFQETLNSLWKLLHMN